MKNFIALASLFIFGLSHTINAQSTDEKVDGKPIKIKKCSCSQEYNESKCGNAIDANLKTDWNAGGFAPQTINLELKKTRTITEIRWSNQMNPNGEVSFEFKFYNKSKELITTINKNYNSIDAQTTTTLFNVENVKTIEITITKSPSWIAVYEIIPYGKK